MCSRLPLLALSCLLLTTPGCRPDLMAGPTLRDKRASPASQTPKTATPSEKPDVGSGRPSTAAARVACPDLPAAAYEAVAQPTALPDRGAPLDKQGTQRWVEALEGQIGWLKAQLGNTLNAYGKCAETVRQAPPAPVASGPPPRAP